MHLREPMSAEIISGKYPHEMNVSEDQKQPGCAKKSASLPKPRGQSASSSAHVRRPELRSTIAQDRIQRVVKRRHCHNDGRRPENPTARGSREERLGEGA